MAIERRGSDLCVLISATDPRRIPRNVEQPCRRRNRDRVEHASGPSDHSHRPSRHVVVSIKTLQQNFSDPPPHKR